MRKPGTGLQFKEKHPAPERRLNLDGLLNELLGRKLWEESLGESKIGVIRVSATNAATLPHRSIEPEQGLLEPLPRAGSGRVLASGRSVFSCQCP